MATCKQEREVLYQVGGHWDACPGRKMLWGDIFSNKNSTFLVFFSKFKNILQISTKCYINVSNSHR